MKKEISLGMITAKRGEIGYPVLDFDINLLPKIRTEIKRLQRRYKLGDCILVKTTNGYHAFFFWNLLVWKEVVRVIDNAKYVDTKFKQFKNEVHFCRIRVSKRKGDLKIKERIYSSNHRENGFGDFYYATYRGMINVE